MNKTELINKNQKNLDKLKKELPKYEWKLSRVETFRRDWDLEQYGNKTLKFDDGRVIDNTDDIKWFYETDEYNKSNGYLEISYDGRGIDLECSFTSNENRKYGRDYEFGREYKTNMEYYKGELGEDDSLCWEKNDDENEKKLWEKSREFFNTYLILREERIEKKQHTPRIDRLYNGMFHIYNYEYNEIMMRLLFGKPNKEYPTLYSTRETYDTMLNNFEEEYGKISDDEDCYFGDTIEMIQSFLEDKEGEVDWFLEKKIKEIKDDMKSKVS
jgi:hypothetical protein